ncbi:formate acetyltransferase [Raphidocelis subcapitata]|uniref:formate C-acetyltransferase n=1 Tax=Raphidocelis subcapitata TaxID=307507 RepID=A0A2V0PSC1_9CHLO|nr:formate acetyltransferase [Raphidocelis subcapitata]|eukprot:GBG00498.1 formate acetyltransferase [Raphidocelis subcapitata]
MSMVLAPMALQAAGLQACAPALSLLPGLLSPQTRRIALPARRQATRGLSYVQNPGAAPSRSSGLRPVARRASIAGASSAAPSSWRGFAASAAAEPARAEQPRRSAKASAIDVARFVQENFKPYYGDASFLAGPTEATKVLRAKVDDLCHAELEKGGVLDVDPNMPSSITAFGPGYIEKDKEVIVGLQTDKPLKRAIKPLGGINMVKNALESYGYSLPEPILEVYSKVRKTHNSGVFDVYTDEMKRARKSGILTGLPDGYGRGRIIGDYRRVALYGVDVLVEAKKDDLKHSLLGVMDDEKIRLREEVQEQIRALKELKEMGAAYGFDLGRPASNAREAVQWLYFGYLGAVKEQDGAAMSMGRIDAFLDTYFEKDLAAGALTEEQAQEIIDHFVMKMRIVRQLRTPEYNELFAGDPTWVTCVVGGRDEQGKSMVTKTSYRLLHTLYNLGPAPEPNLTVLWSDDLPDSFKRFCAKVSLDTSSIQYESDNLMSPMFGSDYGIACCVSAMRIGKDMQFFGARTNLPKILLYILNGGRDEISGDQVGPKFPALSSGDGPLNYEEVVQRLDAGMDWIAGLYTNTMNVIHAMHDKYNYERLQMALHDTYVRRLLAFGVSGLSVTADSLSAIKYAKVTPVRDERGIAVDFKIEGSFPKYGNDDDRVDAIATWLAQQFSNKLSQQTTYRNSVPTLSVLTITSNVVYGKKTGSTPDGRKRGEPFAPGANPLHGRDEHGALASLNSVAKIPYTYCLDGISNTFSLVPQILGRGGETDRARNLAAVLDGYFQKGGHHINVNVLSREMLEDAMEHPEKYPNLTIRVSGYAVHFAKLTREQQKEVIMRTFHTTFEDKAAH